MKKSITFKGVSVFYERYGVGAEMVLLHGFLEDSSMWKRFTEPLAKKFTVTTIDLLGHGKSECTGYVHNMEEQAEMVRSVLRTEKVTDAVIIGHSMGGYIALAFASLYPKTIRGLGLFHSTAYADTEQKKMDRERAIEVIKKHPDLFVETTIPMLFSPKTRKKYSAEINEVIIAAKESPQQGIIANTRGMINRPDRTKVLRTSKVPILFVHGKEDPILDFTKAKTQVANCEHITALFLNGVGHMGHIESPEICVTAFANFVQNCSTKSR